MSGFYTHLIEAIAINKKRRKLYGEVSGGRTKFLSNFLISSEYSTLPFAKFYDQRAASYNKEGIMVVKNDFVPMDVPSFDSDVSGQAAYSSDIIKNISQGNKGLVKALPSSYKSIAELSLAYDETVSWYKELETVEHENEVQFAMTKHVLESVAFIAKNGILYAEQSNNETIKLSGSLINLHKIAIRSSLMIDKMANKFHQENIGIIVNDMPKIPIEEH